MLHQKFYRNSLGQFARKPEHKKCFSLGESGMDALIAIGSLCLSFCIYAVYVAVLS